MLLEVYITVFWVCAFITVVLKSNESLKTKTGAVKLIKPIPALAGAAFIILTLPSASIFYPLLAVSLVLCAFGDIGMEIDILPGLGLFLFSHIFYTANFVWQSALLGFQTVPVVIFAICLMIMFVYIFLYQRYLKTTTKAVEPVVLKAVNVYALMISLTLSASLLLWLSSGAILGMIPFVGAILFVISDSIVGIREFHHDFKNAEVIILTTYYLAIFLLSLGAVVYVL
jgi:uncharacterized membrane protein YhhN